MKNIREKWTEIYDDMDFVTRSTEMRTGTKCDLLAFYDLMESCNPSEKVTELAKSIRQQLLTYNCDLSEGVLMKRYFRWMQTKFDEYDFDNIGLVMSDRIDVELMNSYTNKSNYGEVQKYDERLSEIFRDNPNAFNGFKSSIYKHRSVKIKNDVMLPWQYDKILNL